MKFANQAQIEDFFPWAGMRQLSCTESGNIQPKIHNISRTPIALLKQIFKPYLRLVNICLSRSAINFSTVFHVNFWQ